MNRKVCVVVNSRANYGRVKSLMKAVKEHPELDLQLVVGASATLYRFGAVLDIIRSDGFDPAFVISSIVEGETPTTMAKSTGLGIIEIASVFEQLSPDIVVTVADRFDTMATAIAASYMNIHLAHTQGGEVTGSIDESVRHAITKLAHTHFPATERAEKYLLKMGESPDSVFRTGCPAIDLLKEEFVTLREGLFDHYRGVGSDIDFSQPYLVVIQHPVTTEYGSSFDQIRETLEAIHRVEKEGIQVVWLWPNVDAGSDDVAKGIRMYREMRNVGRMHFFRNFSPEDYAAILNNAKCIVGNSSSGLREGAFLGTPCVNVGSRQSDREHSDNVIHAGYNTEEIYLAVVSQLKHGRYSASVMFGDGSAGRKIAEILSKTNLSTKKRLAYLDES